jgi:hypothetical protein
VIGQTPLRQLRIGHQGHHGPPGLPVGRWVRLGLQHPLGPVDHGAQVLQGLATISTPRQRPARSLYFVRDGVNVLRPHHWSLPPVIMNVSWRPSVSRSTIIAFSSVAAGTASVCCASHPSRESAGRSCAEVMAAGVAARAAAVSARGRRTSVCPRCTSKILRASPSLAPPLQRASTCVKTRGSPHRTHFTGF